MNSEEKKQKECPINPAQLSLIHLLTALAVIASGLSGDIKLMQGSLGIMVLVKAYTWHYSDRLFDLVFAVIFLVAMLTLAFSPMGAFAGFLK